MDKVTRVILAQGYCLLRNALAERLEKEPWIEVCATTSVLGEVPRLLVQYNPHVIITNVSPKCSAGMASLKKIKRDFDWVGMLAFSCDTEFEHLHVGLAFRSGADGYISSVDTPEELVEAIRSIREGGKYISPQAKRSRKKVTSHEETLAPLSQREAEVFCLTGCGYVTKSIAGMMNLSTKTVEGYRERIRAKMKLSGAELLYVSVSFMRGAARLGLSGSDEHQLVKELLLARA